MTVGEAIRAAATRLVATSDTARLDAELLMAHAMGVSRSDMLLRAMRERAPDSFAALVERRMGHEPVAYITGEAEFYGLTLKVTPATLIPRSDSEALIEAAREAFADRPPPQRILDLGTGSGALLLAAMSVWNAADGVGLDASFEALLVAIRNAQAHANIPVGIIGTPDADPPPLRPERGMARFVERDWFKHGWRAQIGTFDLILCNPPYVEDGVALDRQVRDFEPATALFAGPDGLDDYRALIPQLRALMNSGAVAILEIGTNQAEPVTALAEAAGFAVNLRRDLAERPRALVLR
ncbi:N5-glutamine methyltransferase family protein [Erythrobacter dokdonensis]|uniref:N5-glutamine S-adenosyl-L-methionine-dependent methyltransferase n=1 Tax=Erythrobacter dokdonensis DSW-74 TaxID=1300349 RepID=A0A1A7BBI1_9SPHN|nr:HemK/PrmC family methyltransferase [Erythrobacter dokdonensis]OBV09903.1 N5-glutamine S-adenosyl-L-methionine-dependent methyltransferase [Erythrobacter dokdonensis DSW-74]